MGVSLLEKQNLYYDDYLEKMLTGMVEQVETLKS